MDWMRPNPADIYRAEKISKDLSVGRQSHHRRGGPPKSVVTELLEFVIWLLIKVVKGIAWALRKTAGALRGR
ncbi:hypothetical protein ACFLWX_01370 [Chloroflexota bacterium]